jgi:GxxExxY protein
MVRLLSNATPATVTGTSRVGWVARGKEERRSKRRGNVEFDGLSNVVIGCALEVHRQLGPGLLESAYEAALAYELAQAGVPFERQVELPVFYKGNPLDSNYRLDMVVDGQLLLELKSVDVLQGIHEAQLLTYMKLSGLRTGLLINFNETLLKNGIRRRVL